MVLGSCLDAEAEGDIGDNRNFSERGVRRIVKVEKDPSDIVGSNVNRPPSRVVTAELGQKTLDLVRVNRFKVYRETGFRPAKLL